MSSQVLKFVILFSKHLVTYKRNHLLICDVALQKLILLLYIIITIFIKKNSDPSINDWGLGKGQCSTHMYDYKGKFFLRSPYPE